LEKSRTEFIHEKGFDMVNNNAEFKKVKVGLKTLEDATLNLGSFKTYGDLKVRYVDKPTVYRALINRNYD